MDMAERSRAMEDYLVALQHERRKIQVFQRELPLSLHLVNQAIESVRQQIEAEKNSSNSNNNSSGSGGGGAVVVMDEERNSSRPVLEQFLPLKPSLSDEEQEQESKQNHHDNDKDIDKKDHEEIEKKVNKPDWLRSVQLWNQEPDPKPTTRTENNSNNNSVVKPVAVQLKKNGGTGAFQPFEREKRPVKESSSSSSPSRPMIDSTVATGNGKICDSTNKSSSADHLDNKEIKENQQQSSSQTAQRKERRCWSPELHRRFLNALQQLGGSQVATPKQIRELMKVDGLSNDEVKSHLQKYRLHTRRPSAAVQGSTVTPQMPQFVVVGGIWVPPPEYAAAATAVETRPEATAGGMNSIYAPLAKLPSESTSLKANNKQMYKSPTGPLNSPGRGSREGDDNDGEATNSTSPATSSTSSQTTTASPPF